MITNIYIYYPSDRRKKSFSSFFIFVQSVEPTTKTPPAPTKKDATPVPKPGSPVPKAPTVAPKAALEVKSSSPAPPKKSSSPVPPKKCSSPVPPKNSSSPVPPKKNLEKLEKSKSEIEMQEAATPPVQNKKPGFHLIFPSNF